MVSVCGTALRGNARGCPSERAYSKSHYRRRNPALAPGLDALGFNLLWDRSRYSERPGDRLWTGGDEVGWIRGGYNSRRHGGDGFDGHQLWPDGGALSLGWVGLRLCEPRDPSLSGLRGRMGHAPRLHADPSFLYSLRHAIPATGTAHVAFSHRRRLVCRRHHAIEPARDS